VSALEKKSVLELARTRRSVRSFSREPVEIEKVLYALEAGSQAPSGANRQPWRFMIVTEPGMKRRVREASESGEREFYAGVSGEWGRWLSEKGLNWGKPFLEEAPVLVLLFSDRSAPYHRESVWLAAGYILLALQEQGLETLTYTPSDTIVVAESVGAPAGFTLEAVLPIGYSVSCKKKEPRHLVSEVAFLNRWAEKIEVQRNIAE
jgi:nitroreductase